MLKRIADGDESWDQMVPPESLPAVAGRRDHSPTRLLRIQDAISFPAKADHGRDSRK
jgi:hypothetical protein